MTLGWLVVAHGALAAGATCDSLATPPPRVRRWQTQAFREDRLEHMSFALALGIGVGIAARSPGAGAGAAMSVGITKELLDVRFDRGDLAADAVGAGLAAWVVASLTR